jgi:membrane associated rhomboid family serine protease
MVPLGDLVPSRLAPRATQALIAVTTVASVVYWLSVTGGADARTTSALGHSWPGVAASLLLQPTLGTLAVTAVVLWLFGPTVEDRLGRLRYVLLWAACGLAGSVVHVSVHVLDDSMLPGNMVAAGGIAAANLALYPRGRLLVAIPIVVGFDFIDLPYAGYAAFWLAILPLVTTTHTVPLLASTFAAVIVGALGARLLRRPERMKVDWWILVRSQKPEARSK